MDKFGGVFMIQVLEPQRLIGSLRVVACDHGPARVHLAFYQEPGQFFLEPCGRDVRLSISRTVALHLIGLLHVQAGIAKHLRRGAPSGSSEQGASDAVRIAPGQPNTDVLILSWASGTPGITHGTDGDQMELDISEDVVAAFAACLVDELSRMAAPP